MPFGFIMKETALTQLHVQNGAKMVEFGGWHMPLQFSNIVNEHMAVRKDVGVFDVSHMGDLLISGSGALKLLERLCTRNISKTKIGSARYTHMLNNEGHIIDDMLITPLGNERFFVVPNAARKDVILNWIKENKRPDEQVEIMDMSDSLCCIAVQGPRSAEIAQDLLDTDVSSMKRWKTRMSSPVWCSSEKEPTVAKWSTAPDFDDVGNPHMAWIMVSRTGYTGEDGFEIIMQNHLGPGAWSTLLKRGATPVGLGARDTLRLEKGYLLSGTDFDNDRSTIETGYEWVVDFSKEFIGKDIMLKQKEEGYSLLCGIKVESKGIPRHGFEVWADEKMVSTVTSGGMSPVLETGIAMAYMPEKYQKEGTKVQLVQRTRKMNGVLVKMPFV